MALAITLMLNKLIVYYFFSRFLFLKLEGIMISNCGWLLYENSRLFYLPNDNYRIVEFECNSALPKTFSKLVFSEPDIKKYSWQLFDRIKKSSSNNFNVKINSNNYHASIFLVNCKKTNNCLAVILYLCQETNKTNNCELKLRVYEKILSHFDNIRRHKQVKTRTINVVKLTALGFNSKETADALSLSSRGVEYHLEIAKNFLGAINKPNLISLASQEGWI